MAVIPASSGTFRSRVDGTIVLLVEIEPKDRQAALELFGTPGTPMALAALKTGFAAVTEPSKEAEQKEPLGPLAKWLVIRCNEEEFWRWLEDAVTNGHRVDNSEDAGDAVKQLLDVQSRREVDENERAAATFHRWIREPYQKWLLRRSG